jgi:hypothetical protein
MKKALLHFILMLAIGSLSGCSRGSSGPSCRNACPSAGATECSGVQIQTCTADANGCLAWSSAAACPGSLSCNPTQGKCVCSDTCPSVGTTQCSGLLVQTCTADASGCLAWSSAAACPGSLSCNPTQGKCVCNDTCASAGTTRCSGLQIQTCTADASGCLAWSSAASCPGHVTCNSAQGTCIDHPVTLSWASNRESGVNRVGGGYQVSVSGQPTISVPYESGPIAPTTTTARLPPGTYTVTVRAFAGLDAQGGNSGSLSAPSQPISVSVP